MVQTDLRQYIDTLEKEGELNRVTEEVHWDQELGAVCHESIARHGPALLFENIKGHKDTHGRKVLTNTAVVSKKRIYLGLNLPGDAHPLEALRILRERCKRPLRPVMVHEGPCKEVIEKGNQVNLFEFPVPRWHAKDGGRYMVTFAGVVTKDPQTGWVNVGLYRGMVLDKNSLGMLLIPTQHWGIHAAKYAALGKPMPVAITIGSDPVLPLVAYAPFGLGVCEYDIVGAINEQPMELVNCETVDLPVPATSEIVLEGELSLDPQTFKPEGPYAEYPGYYTKLWAEPRPVLKVNCVTHRHDPVLYGFYGGWIEKYPWARPCCTLECITLWDLLEAQGVTGVQGVYGMGPGSSSHHIIVVSVDRTYFGQARQVAAALWGNSLSAQIAKYVIVVDSDVDITDPVSVLTAISNRTRPSQDVVIYPGCFGGPLDPSVAPELNVQTGHLGRWDRVLIDATWPPEWAPRQEWDGLKHPVPCEADPEVIKRVRANWEKYGLP